MAGQDSWKQSTERPCIREKKILEETLECHQQFLLGGGIMSMALVFLHQTFLFFPILTMKAYNFPPA